MIRKVVMGAAALVFLSAAGCSDKNDALLNPQFEPIVSNHVDEFEFQVNGAEKVTQTLSYPWRNTGNRAVIDQSATLTEGTVSVSLRDSTGALLYSKALTEIGTFDSDSGLAGGWAIRLDMHGVSGRFNFRVQKKS